MVIHSSKQLNLPASVSFYDRINKNRYFYMFLSCKSVKCSSYFDSKKKQKFLPVIGYFIKETVIRILGNSLVFMFRIQEAE